ncbi:MAG TPA: phage protease [Phycisphaerae bacterium]|nr:phage protease [Phycisphaerae bacterium]
MAGQTGFELVCAARETDLDAGAREVVIVPAGSIKSEVGTFLMDRVATDLTIAAYHRHGTDLPIDVDHKTVYARDGEPAPAVGWIKALAFRDHVGLLGTVEWTDEGRDEIRSGRFRYLSPVVAVRKSDGRAVALHSAAITTKPAIPNMERLAASSTVGDFLKALREPEGSTTGATPDAIGNGGGDSPTPGPGTTVAADPKARASLLALLGQARDLLSLGEDASLDDVYAELGEFIKAATEAETDTTAMRARIKAEILAEHEVDDVLAGYVQENKLPIANEKTMRAARVLAGRDLATFRAIMDNVAPMVPTGRITPKNQGAPLTTEAEEAGVKHRAATEWAANREELSRWTDEAAFIAMRLRGHAQKKR